MARGEITRSKGRQSGDGASTGGGSSRANGAGDDPLGPVEADAEANVDESEGIAADDGGYGGSDDGVIASENGAETEDAADEAPSDETAGMASAAGTADEDPAETEEWLESLRYVLESKGPERVSYLLSVLEEKAHRAGVELPFSATTPYINTIPADKQPVYPGNREIERRIKSIIRWNAMAMVVRANKEHPGIGGHISTYASAATLYEVGLQPFLPRQGRQFFRRPDLFPRAQLARHLFPGVSGRPAERRATEKFPPGIGPRRRPVARIRIPG